LGDEKVWLADEWGKEMMWLIGAVASTEGEIRPVFEVCGCGVVFFSIGS